MPRSAAGEQAHQHNQANSRSGYEVAMRISGRHQAIVGYSFPVTRGNEKFYLSARQKRKQISTADSRKRGTNRRWLLCRGLPFRPARTSGQVVQLGENSSPAH